MSELPAFHMNHPDLAVLLYGLWLVFDAIHHVFSYSAKRADATTHQPA